MKQTLILRPEGLPALASQVLEILSSPVFLEKENATVILLEGDLGAGKTTFTKELASALGIQKEEVHSPTFILKKEYEATHARFKKLVHVDAYRFTHPEEDKALRLEDDLRNRDALIVVEWPSKMSYIKSDMEITFEVEDEDTRGVTLEYEKTSIKKSHEEKH